MEDIIDEAFPPTSARIRIIDEIGKMELLSQKMSRILTDQIDGCRSDIFVCTIPLKSTHPIVLGSGKNGWYDFYWPFGFPQVVKLGSSEVNFRNFSRHLFCANHIFGTTSKCGFPITFRANLKCMKFLFLSSITPCQAQALVGQCYPCAIRSGLYRSGLYPWKGIKQSEDVIELTKANRDEIAKDLLAKIGTALNQTSELGSYG